MKILFATDGLSPAATAETLLAKLARRQGAEVSVLSVAESAWISHRFPDLMEVTDREARARATEAAEAAVKRLSEHGFDASWQTTGGSPGHVIVETAERDGADVVLLGAGGKSRLGYLMLGSVGIHVLHSSRASVLIVREEPDVTTPGRILVGVDGSSGADAAVEFIPRFADPARCGVSVLAVARSLPPPYLAAARAEISTPYFPVAGAEMPHHTPSEREELRRRYDAAEELGLFGRRYDAEADEAQARAAATLTEAGFDTTGQVVEGHPVERLLEEVEEMDADLLVVGSRGLGSVRRALLGSVSDRVTRVAPATLVVHPTG